MAFRFRLIKPRGVLGVLGVFLLLKQTRVHADNPLKFSMAVERFQVDNFAAWECDQRLKRSGDVDGALAVFGLSCLDAGVVFLKRHLGVSKLDRGVFL